MNATVFLAAAIFLISLLLTMVGLGGPHFFTAVYYSGFAKSQAASASLFLNLIGAASAAYTCSRKKMVDFSLSIPLIVSSSLAAPVGSFLKVHIDLKPFLIIMAAVLAMAGARMLMSPPTEIENCCIRLFSVYKENPCRNDLNSIGWSCPGL
jgi:uncharacterized protein